MSGSNIEILEIISLLFNSMKTFDLFFQHLGAGDWLFLQRLVVVGSFFPYHVITLGFSSDPVLYLEAPWQLVAGWVVMQLLYL